MNKNCAIVTGGLGFIGSNISKKLIETKVVKKVIIVDNFNSFFNPNSSKFKDYRSERFNGYFKDIIFERAEVANYAIMQRIIEKYRPKYIFHLAALPLAKIENLSASEALEGSVIATKNILEIIHHMKETSNYNISRFIYTSSSMVYGDFKKNSVNEKTETNPKDIYGTMKLAGETVTKGLSKSYNINYTIIRPSAVYGPTDMNNRVCQIFIEKAIKGDVINVKGKDEKLDFTYVEDLAQGFILSAVNSKGKNETFNITYGSSRSLYDLVNILQKYFPLLNYKIVSRDQSKPMRGTLNIIKAKKLLGYSPKFSLNKGIKKYIGYLINK